MGMEDGFRWANDTLPRWSEPAPRWVGEFYQPEVYQFTEFISLVKEIVKIWADNLDDSTKRAALLELYPTPRQPSA